ncbi:hypothetical protein [Planktothrix paucivesiculata]|uniref:Uncharacterized protein n=1 Tax=Planktothrix paucivesiculata PCC 9631 TaxID=671071 RepID=A0A7Z9DXD6_9CYAN|nr:hypothetical protein [Planktothrix paucivesiculata]VXD16752.1 conserved hypothetical protein [Planktothrix paucivesiculata PCC 9631]
MKFSDLSQQTLEKINTLRWDRIIEKHEGPESWESVLRWQTVEILEIEGRSVLLPIDQSQHYNLTILRTIWSANGNSVTLFLKDTTYYDDFMSGYLAICDQLKEDNLFVAIVYHEWFIIDNKEVLAGD